METLLLKDNKKKEIINGFRNLVKRKEEKQKQAFEDFKAGKYQDTISKLEALKNKH